MSKFIRTGLVSGLGMLCTLNATAQNNTDTASAADFSRTSQHTQEPVEPQHSQNIPMIPITNFTRLLEGCAPGLQATNGNGQPGSLADIMIRGVSSVVDNNAPLVILDGMVYTGDLNAINLFDIENITLLKDAVATLRYGSRSANGIIEVMTKKGKQKTPARLTFNARAGVVTKALPDYNTLDAGSYYEAAWQAYRNMLITSGMSPGAAGAAASGANGINRELIYNAYNVPFQALIDPATGKLNPNASLRYNDPGWKNALQRTALRHEYQAALSGGGQKNTYYLSAGYLNEGGYIKHTGYERFNSLFKGDINPLQWLRAGVNSSVSYGNQQYATTATDGYNPFAFAQLAAPIYPVYYYNTAGNRETDPATGKDRYDFGSPLLPNSSMGSRPFYAGSNPVAAMQTDDRRLKTLNWTVNPYVEATLFQQLRLRSEMSYIHTGSHNDQTYTIPSAPATGISSLAKNSLKTFALTETLAWEKRFGNHHINAQAGYERFRSDISAEQRTSTGTQPGGISSSRARINTEGYFATGSYDYDQRYYLTAGIRRDGAGNLPDSSKWNNYWAAGLAWKLSNEHFLRGADWLSELKLKANYGKQGYLGLNYPLLDNAAWCNQANAGLELGLWNNRINFEANYFIRNNKNLLLPPFLRPSTNTWVYARGMELKNQGIELTLSLEPLRSNNFSWRSTICFTSYKNEIMKMPAGYESMHQGNKLWTKGNSVYDFYLPEYAGVDAANGNELYYYTTASGQREKTSNYAQALGSGAQNLGSALPAAFGSFNNELRYKNITLSFLFTFGIGGKYYDNTYARLMNYQLIGGNLSADVKDSWTPEHTNASLPRIEVGNINLGQPSSRFLASASYLSLRNLSIDYGFSEKQLHKMKLKSLRIYVAADNLLLISARKGMNPQAVFSSDPGLGYSPARTIVTGFNIGI